MDWLRAAVAALALGAPLAASAAQVTRIASSFEEKDPFGLFLDLGFERTQQRAALQREVRTAEGLEWVNELRYKAVDARLVLGFAVGLYRDLELRAALPIVFQHDERWDFVAGRGADVSSVTNNCVDARGEPLDPACASTGAGEVPLFPVPGQVYRGGLGNLRVGLSYAFFNQAKDDTKPTWLVSLDYEAPTAERLVPDEATAEQDRGALGDRHHHYTLSTALSRRIGVAEPYVRAFYTLPVRGPLAYSNCEQAGQPGATLPFPENCGAPGFSRRETGIRLPHRTGLTFGSELTAFERPDRSQRVALDVRAVANYVSAGRYYNELSGALGRLLSSDDFGELGGGVGLLAAAGDVFQVRLGTTLLYRTEHGLTGEDVVREEGRGSDVAGTPDAINPNFDFRADAPGRRFRTGADYTFRFELAASFSF